MKILTKTYPLNSQHSTTMTYSFFLIKKKLLIDDCWVLRETFLKTFIGLRQFKNFKILHL